MKIVKIVCFLIYWVVFLQIGQTQSPFFKIINTRLYDNAENMIKQDSFFYTLDQSTEGLPNSDLIQILTKWHQNGQQQWQINFSSPGKRVYYGPMTADSDAIYIALLYDTNEILVYKVFKFNQSGKLIWELELPYIIEQINEIVEQFYELIIVNENLRIYFRTYNNQPMDTVYRKNGYYVLDFYGNVEDKIYLDRPNKFEFPLAIEHFRDIGYVKEFRANNNNFVITNKYEFYNLQDSLIWSYQVGPSVLGTGFGPLAIDSSGNIYFTWNFDSSGNNSVFNYLPGIVSLDIHGNFRWQKVFGEAIGLRRFNDIICTSVGQIVACGYEGNYELSEGKYSISWAVSVDSSGSKLWERRFVLDESSESGNEFRKVIQTDDDYFVFNGQVYIDSFPEYGGYDVILLKTDNQGCYSSDCKLYIHLSLLSNFTIPVEQMDITIYNGHKLVLQYDDYNVEGVVRIYAVDGTLLKQKLYCCGYGEIGLGDLPNGNYIYNFVSKDGLISGSRMFINVR